MAIHLNQKEIDFIQSAGVEKIKEAAYHFVRTKLVKDKPVPDRGHPVFKAMRAVGAEDRKSLESEFSIPRDKSLSEVQVDTIVENIMGWLRGEATNSGKKQAKIAEF
jgi:hypothetical protein